MSRAFFTATCEAPSNIAVIKYWGKRSTALNLPINSSVSVTMDTDQMRTVTTVYAAPDVEEDALWLNHKVDNINKRVRTVLSLFRERVARRESLTDASGAVRAGAEVARWKIRIVSYNSFPTAAGLASSASGYACLVYALSQAFSIPLSDADPALALAGQQLGDLTCIARQGSGSACRSLFGGFVRWEMGAREDGADSRAVQVAPADHWPELQLLILVAGAHAKEVPSTDGMQASVATSPLLAHRASSVVPDRLRAMEAAYLARDFETFATLTMQDSNQFHATCLDTFPPIFYLTDASKAVIALVHKLNAALGRVAFGYTFDAGPNAVVFCLQRDAPLLLGSVARAFPAGAATGATPSALVQPMLRTTDPTLLAQVDAVAVPEAVRLVEADALSCIYHTKVGAGPRRLTDEAECLVDLATGTPILRSRAV